MSGAATWARLRDEAAGAVRVEPYLQGALGRTALAADPARGLAALRPVWLPPGAAEAIASAVFEGSPDTVGAALADLAAIARRNFEPGGLAGTWMAGRGFHMLTAHRVAHPLWAEGRRTLAMAWKTDAVQLGADIHPAARLGRGLFLDHGSGVVIGETAVVEDDVCLWHGVTLGGTLMQDGDRHPKVRRGAVLGAHATVLGAIEIGEGAVVAAGSVVLADVPAHTTVAGNPARPKATHRHPYGYRSDEGLR